MSKASNTKSKEPPLTIKIVGTLSIFIIPCIILVLLEVLFYLSYKATSSKYFEDRFETSKRASVYNLIDNLEKLDANKSTFIKDLKTKNKIAIFGGSSAYGYAAPVNFETYLKSIDSDEFIYHNYATAGDPLVGFQEQLIKLVIDYYDIIVIYSGHNEIWSHVYRKSRDSQANIIMPDGTIVEGKLAFQSLHNRMLNLESYLNAVDHKKVNRKVNRYDSFRQLIGLIHGKSRVINFLTRLWYRVIRVLPGSPTNKLPFYFTRPFITEDDKKQFISDYESSILNIIQMLKKDQRLIISTVLSNDLYPPNLDYINATDDQINEWEKTLNSLLERLEIKGQRITERDLKTLPNGAHREYLRALSCMGGLKPVSDLALKDNCLTIARRARSLDKLPYRVLPGVNEFIRKLDGTADNVIVIDPEAYLNAASTQVDYLSFFVDFQHPSSLGHMYIASEISKVLYPGENVKFELSCGTYKERNSFARLVNIKWLKSAIKSSSIDFMHKYYLGTALEHESNCGLTTVS